jgi:pseudaminic acid synthase
MEDLMIEIQTPKGKRRVGRGFPALIIAELSANHGQDLEKAEAIIRQAANAGADAIKLQTYLPSTMTIDCDNEYFQVQGSTGPADWKNQNLYRLYEKAYTPWDWHPRLQKLTHELGMIFFSTPFDSSAVDFLEGMNVPLYKVASYELTDIPLLKKVAATKKPVIISIGFGTLDEVTVAIDTLRKSGSEQIAVLHCVTNYSKEPDLEHTNLSTMLDLALRFNVVVGFSDNTGGIDIPLQAVMMGASIIEKHVIVAEGDRVLDAEFSLGPNEFNRFIETVRRAELIAGKPNYGIRNESENYFKTFRRSIFAVRDIKKGETFNSSNIRVIRPSFGLEPRFYDTVIGKRAVCDISVGTPLTWGFIE